MNKTLKTITIAALILGAMAAAYALGSSGRLTMVEQADRLMGMLITAQPLMEGGDGKVYAVGGQGNQLEGEPGMSSSLPLSESVKRYENGKMLTYGTSVNIEAEVISEPEKIIVSQFDAAGKLLSSESFTPGALPDSMESTAAYIVVGTVSQIGAQYEVFQPDDGSISALYCREDNVCVMQSCIVGWEGE